MNTKFDNIYSATLIKRNPSIVPGKNCWFTFAEMYGLTIKDLNKFASLLGYKDLDGLRFNVSPRQLLRAKANFFLDALREVSQIARKKEDSEIINSFVALWGEPIGTTNLPLVK